MVGDKYFGFAALGLLILVVLIAGCTQKAPQTGKTAEQDGQQAAAQTQEPPSSGQSTPSLQCTKNTDCNDNDPCTTDSCTAGVCKYTPVPDCQFRVEEKPRIVAVNFGDFNDEFVQIDGKNYNIAGWKITNAKGDLLAQFNKNEYRLINGKITIYSGCGTLSTTTVIYQCLGKELFSNIGDKAILYDENQTAVSEKRG